MIPIFGLMMEYLGKDEQLIFTTHNTDMHDLMSPCFLGITDFREITEASVSFINEYWFENLNLRGDYKQRILAYIHDKYPRMDALSRAIYLKNDESYWVEMEKAFTKYCEDRTIRHADAFYHSRLVEEKAGKTT